MRFCIVTTQENSGGGEVLIASIADELQSAGHEVAWIARRESQVAKELAAAGQTVLHLVRSRGRNARDLAIVRRRIIKDWNADVVVMNDTHAVVLAGLATAFSGKRRPVRLAYKHTVFPLRSKLKYQFLCDRVVCVSQAAKDTVVAGGLPDQNAVVVYGGAAKPTVEPEAREVIRRELGLKDSVQLVVCVGNLLACKGHHDLVDAVAKLDRENAMMLAIAGEGSERKALEDRIAVAGLQGRVRLLGFRDDANRLLQAADVVVHPSHSEGLSLVLIQAQLLGKPIVATAVGGAAEVLQVASGLGDAAWIVEPKNSLDLADKLSQALRLVKDPQPSSRFRDQLVTVSNRAAELFSLSNNTRKLADLASQLRTNVKAKSL